jgi:hypothetical protein
VAVLLHDAPTHETVTLRCPGGFVEQVTVESGIALFAATPVEDCQLSLHDDTMPTTVRAVPGARLLCSALEEGTRCVDVNQALEATPEASVGTTGKATIELDTRHPITAVEVSCPGGYRERVAFESGRAVIPDLPAESCRGQLKGGLPKAMDLTGGVKIRCRDTRDVIICGTH